MEGNGGRWKLAPRELIQVRGSFRASKWKLPRDIPWKLKYLNRSYPGSLHEIVPLPCKKYCCFPSTMPVLPFSSGLYIDRTIYLQLPWKQQPLFMDVAATCMLVVSVVYTDACGFLKHPCTRAPSTPEDVYANKKAWHGNGASRRGS